MGIEAERAGWRGAGSHLCNDIIFIEFESFLLATLVDICEKKKGIKLLNSIVFIFQFLCSSIIKQ